jgi:glucosamine-6-phosphate isomerase
MQLKIYEDYNTLSSQVASEIIDMVKNNPQAVLCLAAGDTPRLTYALMAQKAKQEEVDFSHCTFIGLDEWVGIPPDNEGSCHFFLETNIFKPLNISSSQIHLFDALAGNTVAECGRMDKIISEKGGIDLMLVGVGMNGHIGFNEPGVAFDTYSHVIDLDATTQSVGQKYFNQHTTLKQGITLGLNHLLEAGKVLLIASGVKKSAVMEKALEGEIINTMPASIIRTHPHGFVMIDEEAASRLQRTPGL